MIKQIIFCTLRNNKGATGGPGGVLFLQKSTLGSHLNGIPCRYMFNVIEFKLGKYSIPLNRFLYRLYFSFIKDAYFFTHDIEMASLLSDLGKKYSLIYHHQGPLQLELKNLGVKLTQNEINQIRSRERKAFCNANTLHFPSKGAADMYFDSEYANCKLNEVNLVEPLYNIIPLIEPNKPDNIEYVYDSNYITFFSLGTLTEAKGQDLTIDLIEKFVKVSTKPIRYFIVGKGPMKDVLIESLDRIKQSNTNFSYYYFESLPHEVVMYFHKICDFYIMLHRVSIFDFATLEAMSQHSAIILSRVGGNIDFNISNNILFSDTLLEDISILNDVDLDNLKKLNYSVFSEFFSKEAFIKQYEIFFNKYALNK